MEGGDYVLVIIDDSLHCFQTVNDELVDFTEKTETETRCENISVSDECNHSKCNRMLLLTAILIIAIHKMTYAYHKHNSGTLPIAGLQSVHRLDVKS